MFPVFGREIVEREQFVAVLSQALAGRVVFRLVLRQEGVERVAGILARGGQPDFMEVGLGTGLHALG